MSTEDVTPIILASNYSGASEDVPFSTRDLLKLTDQNSQLIYGPTLFALKYRVVPCVAKGTLHTSHEDDNMFTYDRYGSLSIGRLLRPMGGKQHQSGMYHATSAIRFLVDEYKIDPNTFLYDWNYDTTNTHSLISNIYIDLGNYLSIQFNTGGIAPKDIENPNNLEPDQEDKAFYYFNCANVYHVPQTADRARTLLQQLTKFKIFPLTSATLQMVCHDERRGGFYTSAIRMQKPHITDLKLHYGDEFPSLHEELIEILQEKDSTGITFLHGPPGTGKTYYLRYLINEIQNKKLIYVPPDLVKDMTKPGFLPFLMQHPNSILIVEDAENIIQDRVQNNFLPNQAVANLLNLSDGLLGDAIRQQIICTFNCDVKGIDPALLRDGRLVIEHKFDKLSIGNARRLCVELGIPNNGEDIHESITLAEIYTRKNNATTNLTDGIENGDIPTKTKRSLRKKKQQSDNLFGFYS